MIKGKELLGRPIVALSNGEQVDNVRDVIFDPQGNQVLALLTDEAGWFSAARAVPYGRVQSIGEKAVMIASPEDVTTTRKDDRLKHALETKTNLIGMTLLTTGGENLGKISDVYFDAGTGRVEGYEATGGLFSDMTRGRTFIPAPGHVQIGADAAIVPDSVATAMREQVPGGIQGAFHTAGQTLTGAVTGAAQSVREGYEQTASQVRGAVDDLGETFRERSPGPQTASAAPTAAAQVSLDFTEPRRAQPAASEPVVIRADLPSGSPAGVGAGAQVAPADLVGRRVQEDVRSPSGSFLAVQGQIVTDAVAGRARELGAEDRLIAATRPQPAGGVAETATEWRDNLADGLANVSQGTTELLGRAKNWLGEKRDEAEDALDRREREVQEARIRDALGRPVTRVILAPDDRVILNVGEVVTHRAVQEARAAGVLDLLLNDVETGRPRPDLEPPLL